VKFTDEQIKRSIDSGVLQLDRGDKLALLKHGVLKTVVFTALGLFCVSLILFGFWNNPSLLAFTTGIVIVGLIVFLIALTLVKIKSLRLTEIKTSFTTKETRDILAKFARLYRWKVENNRDTLIVLIAKPSNRYSSAHSERIMLLMENGRILASCFCDTEQTFRYRSLINGKQNLNLIGAMVSGNRIPTIELKKRKKRKRTEEDSLI
jgi:hypothetical protein